MLETLDRYFPWLASLCAATCAAALGMIFFYAPVEQTMGIVQKIFYVHVPSAMAAYAGFVTCSLASLIYLLRPNRRWDIAARSGAELGLAFCVYVLISGPLWAYKAWGKAWVWDPQLTLTFVLFMLFGGYVALRTLSDDSHTMRLVAAVLGVIASAVIPFIHYAVKYWGGLHPVVEREGGGGLAPAMRATFGVSMLAFLLLFATLLWMIVRARLMALHIDELHLELEDLAAAQSPSA